MCYKGLRINSEGSKWYAYSEEKAQVKDESIMMTLQSSSEVPLGKVPSWIAHLNSQVSTSQNVSDCTCLPFCF